MTKHHAVIVTWKDSATLRGWNNIDAEHAPSEITTLGWLLRKTKDQVTITSCISDHGNTREALAIPRSCVVSIKKLPQYVEGQ